MDVRVFDHGYDSAGEFPAGLQPVRDRLSSDIVVDGVVSRAELDRSPLMRESHVSEATSECIVESSRPIDSRQPAECVPSGGSILIKAARHVECDKSLATVASVGEPTIAVDIAPLIDLDSPIDVERIDPSEIRKCMAYEYAKRAFDTIIAGVAILLLALPMLVIAVLIKIDSPGPIFYRQTRLGLGGVPFELIKFRSMRTDAEAAGARWALKDDPRVTRVGRFIRRTRIDELPQLFQVVSGKLSIVGPRPERPIYYDKFEQHIHGFYQRLVVRPGITGLAQINGGYELRPAEKIIFDIEYIKNRSLLLDLQIVLKTISVVCFGQGAR